MKRLSLAVAAFLCIAVTPAQAVDNYLSAAEMRAALVGNTTESNVDDIRLYIYINRDGSITTADKEYATKHGVYRIIEEGSYWQSVAPDSDDGLFCQTFQKLLNSEESCFKLRIVGKNYQANHFSGPGHVPYDLRIIEGNVMHL